jgi:hypothetical protein
MRWSALGFWAISYDSAQGENLRTQTNKITPKWGDFIGAGTGTLTLGLILGKDAL